MPPVDPEAKIPCPTPGHLQAELERLVDVLTPPETEDSWEKMEKAIIRFAGITRGGGYKHVDVYVGGVGRTGIGSRLVDCMLSDRGRLSGAATDLLTALAPRLGLHFAPLIPLYLPPVVRLLARPNKIFLKRADKCLSTIITHCPIGTMLPYIGEGTMDKSEACRRASSTGLARACDEWSKETFGLRGVAELENCLRKIAVDKDAEVRKIGKRIWTFYTAIWPERVEDFSAPLTPTIRRYLDISATAGGPSKARVPVKARPAPPSLLSSSSSTTGPSRPAPQPQRLQALASKVTPVPAPVRSARAESKMPAADRYVEEGHRTTVHREKLEVELARPLLSRAAASMAPLQGAVRPDVRPDASRQGRSHSAAVLSSGAMREPNAEHSRPVRLPLPPSHSNTHSEFHAEPSVPRRFAPPARLAKHINPEDFDAEQPEASSGPLRGAARAMPMGETRRQLMGQAQRRAHPGPGPTLSAPVNRPRPEVDLAEIAIRAAMLPLPASPPRQATAAVIEQQQDEHPASPSPIRPPQPSLAASTSSMEPTSVMDVKAPSPLAELAAVDVIVTEQQGSAVPNIPESQELPSVETPPLTQTTLTNESTAHHDLAPSVTQINDDILQRESEGLSDTSQVRNDTYDDSAQKTLVTAEAAREVVISVEEGTATAAPDLEKPAHLESPHPESAPRPATSATRAAFKPRVPGRAPVSGSRQPFKPTPSPSAIGTTASSASSRNVIAARAVSASSVAGPSKPTASKATKASPTKPAAPASRPPSATGRSVSSSTGPSRPTASSSSRSASPTKVASSQRPISRTTKPPIPPIRREPIRPVAAATTALKRSATSKPLMAPPPVPAVRKERVRLKAPLPSFVPKKPTAPSEAKGRVAKSNASSPVKAKTAVNIPLPASPVHPQAIACPLPPSPERPQSARSEHAESISSIPLDPRSPSRISQTQSTLGASTSASVEAPTESAGSDAASDGDVMEGVTFQPRRTSVSQDAEAPERQVDDTVKIDPPEGDLLQLAAEEPRLQKKMVPMTPGRSLAIKLGFLEGPGTPGTPVPRLALSEKDPNVAESEGQLLIDF